ncbi:choline dehydrogenase [Rhodobacterales bacterium 52_120_T64]|nr:choline dehydrogenase [Rhodobacterales bacterium 52_120_T64]
MSSFDYIIVGAGSAGCVLAEKLSRGAKHSVLLLEAGGSNKSPWVSLPLGYGRLFNDPTRNWNFSAAAQETLNGREDFWPRGKLVGGSGSINAMVYCRGLQTDFEDWHTAGATGWNWDEVKRHYDKIETNVSAAGEKVGNGPIHLQDTSKQIHQVNRHYFDAMEELGLPISENCNGPEPEGAAVYRINTKEGRRCSSADGFLKPALQRKNLELRINTPVRRVIITDGRAVGVETASGKIIHARAEVILAAGSVASPQLLQLSGIGPGKVLQRYGVSVLVDNPNVGGNLQDHLGINYYFQATEPTLNNVLRPWYGKVRVALQYALTGKGPLSLSINQCGGFFRSSPDQPRPNVQLYFNPVSYKMQKVGKRTTVHPDPFPGFIISPQPSRPTSRGRIDIQSPDVTAVPLIQPNSLATEQDQMDVIAAGQFCQRIMQSAALKKLVKSPINPDLMRMDADTILTDFRARCGTVFHPTSTCRMGADAQTAVLDTNLSVFGVRGLRVIDASAFPNITSGNTNAPTMMLAHRGAELILKMKEQP